MKFKIKDYEVLGAVLGLGGFLWALQINWKLAVAIFVMLWGNNLTLKKYA